MTALASWSAVAVSGVLGLLFGSFANVAIHRWPRRQSVVRPASSCPSCGAAIRPRDNLPVASWLLLRGRCRDCATPIHWRYPAVEVLTAAVWAAMAAVHGAVWYLPALLLLGWALVVATFIDLEFKIIPNRLTYPLAPALLVLLTAAAALDGAWVDLRRAVIAGVALPAGMFLFSEAFYLLRRKQGMGMGDVKLAASLGLVLGFLGGWYVAIGLYGSVFAAVIVAFALIATGRAGLASRIPFGPYLAIGTLVAVIGGEPISRAVAAWLGLA